MNIRVIAVRTILVLAGIGAGLGFTEGLLRLQHRVRAYRLGAPVGLNPLFRLTSAPYRYELTPNLRGYQGKIDTNELGLRGPAVPDAAPWQLRALFLGDSVTFGGEYPYADLFTTKLGAALWPDDKDESRYVPINAGVPGYSPFNELEWLHMHGSALAPNLIVIQFCVNDVVDPLPHWQAILGTDLDDASIPSAAIPDATLHRDVVRLQPYRSFILLKLLRGGWNRLHRSSSEPANYLSLDSSLTVDVYADPQAPQRRWLEDAYRRLIAEALRITPRVFVLIVPAAYQLSGDRPIDAPQELLKSVSADAGALTVDLTPALRQAGAQNSFRLNENGQYYDVWHLSKQGHEIAAREIARAYKSLL